MSLHVFETGATERHALIDGAVIADLGGFANHHAHAVIDDEPAANARAGVNFNAGEEACPMRDPAPQPLEAVRPAPVGRPVHRQGVQAGVTGEHLPGRSGGRITFEDAADVFSQTGEEHEGLLLNCFCLNESI